jgi:hypothetical protein
MVLGRPNFGPEPKKGSIFISLTSTRWGKHARNERAIVSMGDILQPSSCMRETLVTFGQVDATHGNMVLQIRSSMKDM